MHHSQDNKPNPENEYDLFLKKHGRKLIIAGGSATLLASFFCGSEEEMLDNKPGEQPDSDPSTITLEHIPHPPELDEELFPDNIIEKILPDKIKRPPEDPDLAPVLFEALITVVDSNNNPIKNARVDFEIQLPPMEIMDSALNAINSLANSKIFTDDKGQCRFALDASTIEDLEVLLKEHCATKAFPCYFDLKVKKVGFDTNYLTSLYVEPKPGARTAQAITLQQAMPLEGCVLDAETNDPISNAEVKVTVSGYIKKPGAQESYQRQEYYYLTSDENGSICLKDNKGAPANILPSWADTAEIAVKASGFQAAWTEISLPNHNYHKLLLNQGLTMELSFLDSRTNSPIDLREDTTITIIPSDENEFATQKTSQDKEISLSEDGSTISIKHLVQSQTAALMVKVGGYKPKKIPLKVSDDTQVLSLDPGEPCIVEFRSLKPPHKKLANVSFLLSGTGLSPIESEGSIAFLTDPISCDTKGSPGRHLFLNSLDFKDGEAIPGVNQPLAGVESICLPEVYCTGYESSLYDLNGQLIEEAVVYEPNEFGYHAPPKVFYLKEEQ